jgi:putative peptide zinc metalloprotease protein
VSSLALTDLSLVELYPLHVGGGPDEPEIGRPETGTFISLPVEGMELVRLMQMGLPLGGVAERFAASFGQAPDLNDFVDGLMACGFVRAIDGQPVGDEQVQVAPSAGWQVFANLPSERVAWLLSRPMRWVYAAIWLAGVVALALRPDLVPTADEAWIYPRVMLNAVALTLLGWALAGSHELAHLLAVRALGCPGFLGISHRLHLLVAQTDLTAVRSLPREQRYAPYLAGMTWDMAVLLACTLLRMAGVAWPVLGAISFLALVSILSQFAFFLRTDIYFVLVNWLRLGNLMQDTRDWLANCLNDLIRRPRPHDLSAVPPRELRVARWFAGLWILGVGIVVGEFLLLGLPLLLRMLAESVAGLAQGPEQPLAFWDGLAFVLIVGLNFGILGVLSVRDFRAGRVPQRATAIG